MNLKVHEQILREALGDGHTMSPQALGWVITANKLSDLHQFAPERHFDNAPNREALCERWEHGFKTYLDRAVELSVSVSGKRQVLKDRKGALQSFGAASHALADFYAHTNWVELGVTRGDSETLAPLCDDIFRVDDFPAELESGYFSLRYGMSGCPKTGAPQGYTYCHEGLAKDHPDKGHGADRAQMAGPTYHELAVALAIRATRQLWTTLCNRIMVTCSTMTDVDVSAVIFELAWGKRSG